MPWCGRPASRAVSAAAPHDPPRSAVACRKAIGRPILCQLFLLYPPHPRTEEATIREAQSCRREGIAVNVFLLSGWSQSREDIQFACRLAETAKGRVFFTAGRDLDRFVVWDYVSRRRSIIG